MRNQRGQSLIFLVLLLPVVLLLLAISFRSGMTALVHQKVQHLTDERVLDILKIQADAIHHISLLNPYARTVIISRRIFEALLLTSVLTPNLTAMYLNIIRILKSAQKVIGGIQKALEYTAAAQVMLKFHEPLPFFYRGKVKIITPLLPPALQIEDAEGYKDETGAPKVLKKDFKRDQTLLLEAQIQIEKFLGFWKATGRRNENDILNFNAFKDMRLTSFGQIEMDEIQAKWVARLREKGTN